MRSLVEPIRSVCRRKNARFLQCEAQELDLENKEIIAKDDQGRTYHQPYDRLIIAVGSQSMTFGVPGLEHCNKLKTITDARETRARVIDCFERASLPTTTPKEKEKLLSFVICGGGPTGVEFAAELYDFLVDDLPGYFPSISRDEVQVSIIQSGDHILNTYDKEISSYTEQHFSRSHINVITNHRVRAVAEDHIVYARKPTKDDPNPEEKILPFGMCMWTTGIAMTPFTKHLKEQLGGAQKNARALETDSRLRVAGVPDGSVYALGDCSTIMNPKLVRGIVEYFEEADTNHDGVLDHDEFAHLSQALIRRFPHTEMHLSKAGEIFRMYDKDGTGSIDLDEFRVLLSDIDQRSTTLPATAQVAAQQGKYLAKKLNTLAAHSLGMPGNAGDGGSVPYDEALARFHYSHLGSLAYVGGTAVADFGDGFLVKGLFGAKYLWRGVYWSEQVSFRTRALLALDWTKELLFGRDSSRF